MVGFFLDMFSYVFVDPLLQKMQHTMVKNRCAIWTILSTTSVLCDCHTQITVIHCCMSWETFPKWIGLSLSSARPSLFLSPPLPLFSSPIFCCPVTPGLTTGPVRFPSPPSFYPYRPHGERRPVATGNLMQGATTT